MTVPELRPSGAALTPTDLSVGLVDRGIATTAQALGEDEVCQFGWCKAGAGSHGDRTTSIFPFWAGTQNATPSA